MYKATEYHNQHRVVAVLEQRPYLNLFTVLAVWPEDAKEVLYSGNDETLAHLAINDHIINCS